jgi:hypothetical protein
MKPTMPDGTTVAIPIARPPRRARPPAIRIAAAILTTAALALFTAACSSPSSADPGSAGTGSPAAAGPASSTPAAGSTAGSTAGSSATTQSVVAYSQCMRANGVPKYPDPDSAGRLPKGDASAFDVSNSTYQAAQRTCQHLLPTSGSFDELSHQCIQAGDCPPALVQQMLTADRKFAQCMRSHGVPNWPDPTLDPNGAPVFKVSAAGITHTQTHSPPMENTIMACLRTDPAPAALS